VDIGLTTKLQPKERAMCSKLLSQSYLEKGLLYSMNKTPTSLLCHATTNKNQKNDMQGNI
jgi:hypothetical protein